MPTCKLPASDPRDVEQLLEQLKEIEREWCGLGWWCRQMARYVKKYQVDGVVDLGAESVNTKPRHDQIHFHDALAQLRPHLPKAKNPKPQTPKHGQRPQSAPQHDARWTADN